MSNLTLEALEALERRLRPGGASETGFLAAGQSLDRVIEEDRRALQSLGLRIAQVADRLELVIGRAERMFTLATRSGEHPPTDEEGGRVAMVEPELRVRAWHSMGHQVCPFGDGAGRPCPVQPWASADYELTRTSSGTKIRVPGLLPHLVRAHSFFEGDVPYRVAPARLAEVLALEPGSRAAPQWRTERIWVMFSATSALPWFGIGGPRKHWASALMDALGYGAMDPPDRWDEKLEIAPTVTACRAADWCVVFARKPARLADGVRLDGSEFAISREMNRGTFQLRRVEARYVALEGE